MSDLTEYNLLKRKNRENGYIQLNLITEDIISLPIYEFDCLVRALNKEESWYMCTDIDGCDVICSIRPENLVSVQVFPADYYKSYIEHVDEMKIRG